MNCLNNTSLSSIKYYQKINKIRLSKVFFILNVLCFLSVSLIFYYFSSTIICIIFLMLTLLFIVECHLITFYRHN